MNPNSDRANKPMECGRIPERGKALMCRENRITHQILSLIVGTGERATQAPHCVPFASYQVPKQAIIHPNESSTYTDFLYISDGGSKEVSRITIP